MPDMLPVPLRYPPPRACPVAAGSCLCAAATAIRVTNGSEDNAMLLFRSGYDRPRRLPARTLVGKMTGVKRRFGR